MNRLNQSSMHIEMFRKIKDFPYPGTGILDITRYLSDREAFRYSVDMISENIPPSDIIVGIESYGFILGGALAHNLGRGFVPMRKDGKLPGYDISGRYSMKYRTENEMCMNSELVRGLDCVIIDEVIDTGGTIYSAIDILNRSKGIIKGIGALIAERSTVQNLMSKYNTYTLYYFDQLKERR